MSKLQFKINLFEFYLSFIHANYDNQKSKIEIKKQMFLHCFLARQALAKRPSKMHPKCPPGALRSAQELLRNASSAQEGSDAPTRPPRGSQDAPKRPPSGTQEAP